MKINAHAKINVCLNVVKKRNDGYHELEMIMVPLMLHDTITMELAEEDNYSCSEQSLSMDSSNTVVKAVELMRNTFSLKEHFKIHIEKKIPAQAGLAGGSADAAAVMKGIRELMQINISIEELAQLGKQVGADVPFCIMETCALVKGIGEKITPFSMPTDFYVLLVKPSLGVPTGKAFSMLDFDKCDHPDCDKVMKVLKEGNLDKLSSVISNSLEYSAFQIVPEIYEIKEKLKDMGFEATLMSGSGSTVFALTRHEALINNAMQQLQSKEYFLCKTRIKE